MAQLLFESTVCLKKKNAACGSDVGHIKLDCGVSVINAKCYF